MKTRLLPLLAALALPLSAQVTTTLLNDTFADGERLTQSLPDSARWVGSVGSGPSVVDNRLTQTSSSSNPIVLGYFTNAGSAVTLGVGESISLSFNVSFANPMANTGGFRFGLFDSSDASSRKTADTFSRVDPTFADYSGYFTTATLSGGPGARFYERNGADLIGGSLGDHTQVGSNGGSGKSFIEGNVYTVSLIYSRTASDTLSLSVSYTGIFSGDSVAGSTVSHTVSDTSSPTFDFDTIAFYLHGTTTADSFTLDNVKLDYTAVPEPSTIALLLGGAALGAGVLIRRKRIA